MKILVTGGAGFIGSHLVDLLIREGYEVFIIDNLSTGKKENLNPRAIFYNEDLSDHEKIKEIFQKENPEIIYHLAAQINIRESLENPVEDVRQNIVNTLNLLELSRKFNVKHFIFSSTGGAIYGDTKEIPTSEECLEKPISPYGCAKLAIEKYLNFYNKVYGLKFTSLRYSNVFGPRQNSEGEAGVISMFFDKMFLREKPTIWGGLQTRDFVFVEDVAKANLLALQDEKSAIYNVGTAIETDIIEIFSHINKFFKEKFEPQYTEMKKGGQKKSCLSYKKIKENLGWEPETNLNDGLEKIYIWNLKRLNKLPL